MNNREHYDFDVAIVGAGPAGIQAAYYLKKHGISYCIFEASDKAGAFFVKYPIHRQLISINKVYTGYQSPEVSMRWDWNSLLSEEYAPLFKNHSEEYFPPADCIVDYLGEFVEQHELEVRYNSSISNIENADDGVYFTSGDEQYYARKLIVATGLVNEYLPQTVPGIEHAVTYGDMSLEPDDYKDKRVLILGKGNSAFETADYLVPYASLIHLSSSHPVQFAWKTHYVGHLRAVNNNVLDTYQLKSQNAVLDADIRAIEKDGDEYRVIFEYQHAQGEVEEIRYDMIISCCGFAFDTSLFKNGHPLCEKRKYPTHHHDWQSTEYDNVFFAGTIMHYRDYRKYTSGFIHGFRYNVKRLAEIVACQVNSDIEPESYPVASITSILSNSVIERINLSSAMWQQPGFLCDFYHLETDNTARLYPEQSIQSAEHRIVNEKLTGFVVTLEYGAPIEGDVFAAERIHRDNADQADDSKFLHPILKFYQDGRRIDKKHIIEDLFGEWKEEVHIDQVNGFIEAFMETVDKQEMQAAHA